MSGILHSNCSDDASIFASGVGPFIPDAFY